MFAEDLKRNNLTGIQILAALLVVFSHSYRLGEGMLCPLTRYSLKNISFGTLAVGARSIRNKLLSIGKGK